VQNSGLIHTHVAPSEGGELVWGGKEGRRDWVNTALALLPSLPSDQRTATALGCLEPPGGGREGGRVVSVTKGAGGEGGSR
jgi:hypothetical protein